MARDDTSSRSRTAGERVFAFHTAYGQKTVVPGEISTFLTVAPPESAPDDALLQPLVLAFKQLLEIDATVYATDPARSFGLDARVAHALTEDEHSGLNPRKLLIRPAPEPLIYSYWERFRSWSLDDASVAALASCLCGRDVGYRAATAATMPGRTGVSVLYPEAEMARGWLRKLPVPGQGLEPLEGLSLAFFALGSFVLHHPLIDGNGRYGRALFQGVLARTVGLSSPMLALGALTYAQGPRVLNGWVQLGTKGDWTGLVQAYQSLLEGCVVYHRRVFDASRF